MSNQVWTGRRRIAAGEYMVMTLDVDGRTAWYGVERLENARRWYVTPPAAIAAMDVWSGARVYRTLADAERAIETYTRLDAGERRVLADCGMYERAAWLGAYIHGAPASAHERARRRVDAALADHYMDQAERETDADQADQDNQDGMEHGTMSNQNADQALVIGRDTLTAVQDEVLENAVNIYAANSADGRGLWTTVYTDQAGAVQALAWSVRARYGEQWTDQILAMVAAAAGGAIPPAMDADYPLAHVDGADAAIMDDMDAYTPAPRGWSTADGETDQDYPDAGGDKARAFRAAMDAPPGMPAYDARAARAAARLVDQALADQDNQNAAPRPLAIYESLDGGRRAIVAAAGGAYRIVRAGASWTDAPIETTADAWSTADGVARAWTDQDGERGGTRLHVTRIPGAER